MIHKTNYQSPVAKQVLNSNFQSEIKRIILIIGFGPGICLAIGYWLLAIKNQSLCLYTSVHSMITS